MLPLHIPALLLLVAITQAAKIAYVGKYVSHPSTEIQRYIRSSTIPDVHRHAVISHIGSWSMDRFGVSVSSIGIITIFNEDIVGSKREARSLTKDMRDLVDQIIRDEDVDGED